MITMNYFGSFFVEKHIKLKDYPALKPSGLVTNKQSRYTTCVVNSRKKTAGKSRLFVLKKFYWRCTQPTQGHCVISRTSCCGITGTTKETEGFEPSHAFIRLTVFETVLLSHLSMSPDDES